MPRVGLRGGEAASGVHLGESVELRQPRLDEVGARVAEPAQGTVERGSDSVVEVGEQVVPRHG